jgi:L-seryl-tRNA(Ser) seleniumtransferase
LASGNATNFTRVAQVMDHDSQHRFRELPAVNEILTLEAVAPLVRERGRESVREWVRAALTEVRDRISAGSLNGSGDREEYTELVLESVQQQAAGEQSQKLGGVVNATGIILHTGLGRAPLCAAAIAAIAEAAAACNLEVDLSSGERSYRGYQLQDVWQRLTVAEAALVVNNNAAATLLALDALCRGREVIISRGQLIEIGGSFRLPDIFVQSGAILREVGTTNRTHLADYERAIGPDTAAILRVHPSNYRVVGFTEEPSIAELAPLAHQYGLACIDDIGSGCLVDTRRFGLPEEPTFQQSLAAGADLVLGSGDKLLGGPQCGILLGRAELIERLSIHPLARAFRIDKLTLAALSATLDAYLRGVAEREIPTLLLLAASQAELVARAHVIRNALHGDASEAVPPLRKGGSGGGRGEGDCKLQIENCKLRIDVTVDEAPVGGGSLPGAVLPTAVLRVVHEQLAAGELARRLRLGHPSVFGRVQGEALLLDLRSVLPDDDQHIAAVLRDLAIPGSTGPSSAPVRADGL